MEAPMIPRNPLYVRSGYKRLRLSPLNMAPHQERMVRSYARRRGRTGTATLTRRKRRTRRGGRRINRGLTTMWPRFKLVKLKVVSTGSWTIEAANAVEQFHISANSLSQPHGGMGTNLPLGLDQLAALYKKYVVVGSTHYARVHNVTSTGSVVYGLALREPGVNTALSNPEAYIELPRSRSKMLSPDMDHSGVGLSFNAKRYFGIRRFMDAEDVHATLALQPSAPSKLAYVTFFAGDLAGAQEATIEYIFTSEYVVLLFDPVHPTRSAY